MGEVELSILMPVRDGGERLSGAIESCVEQMEAGQELVLVDDGSTDGSRAVMEATAEAWGRVVVLEVGGGGGLVGALQAAAAAARGRFLGRMDADDFSLPGRFAAQLGYLRANPRVAACGCGVRIRRFGASGKEEEAEEGFREYERWMNGLCDPGAIAAQRFVESPLVHPSVVMRREAFEEAGGYRDVAWAEDYDLWLRMLEKGFLLGKLEEVYLEWRDSAERLTRTDGRYAQDRFLQAKAHYLGRVARVRELGVAICGAGPTGKRVAGFLGEEGVEVKRFIEVHPRRIGERIGGIPVVGEEGMPSPGDVVVLGAVGQRGKREVVRGLAERAGFVEGEDYFAVA